MSTLLDPLDYASQAFAGAMGQTQPRSSKTSEDFTEDVTGVAVPQVRDNREAEVQEPVFGSPIDSKSDIVNWFCSK